MGWINVKEAVNLAYEITINIDVFLTILSNGQDYQHYLISDYLGPNQLYK